MLKGLIPAMALLAASPAFAHQYYDTARVISVQPRYVQARYPDRPCRDEAGAARDSWRRSNTGAIIGGVAGAILGNQIGAGNGKLAATVIGVATGAIVGDRLDNGTVVARGRRTVHGTRWLPRGYTVVYRYRGRAFTSVMPVDPGATVRVPRRRGMVSVRERDFRYRYDHGRHRAWNRHHRDWDDD